MDTIRTTITLPVDLHEELRMQALKEKKSLGEIIVSKFRKARKIKSIKNIEQRIKRDLALFEKIGRSGIPIDPVKAVREERDRDNA